VVRCPGSPSLLSRPAHTGAPTLGTLRDAMLSFTSAGSFAASGVCPPAQFHTLGSSFNLTEYTRATWYIQKQQVTGYQNLSELFCVAATYALEGKTVPLSNDTVATVYNYGNEGRVNGPNQNAGNTTLCARAVDSDDPSKLAVAPCFLPNSLAGPYWVVAVGIDQVRVAEGLGPEYTWAVVIAGQPTIQLDDGCTTTETGVNNAGLWFFSRSPVAPLEQIAAMEAVLQAKGIASSELKDVVQAGCSYAGAFIKP